MTVSVIPLLLSKGDLLGYASSPQRVPVGTDGYPLIADAAQTLGVGYATRVLSFNSQGVDQTGPMAYGTTASSTLSAGIWKIQDGGTTITGNRIDFLDNPNYTVNTVGTNRQLTALSIVPTVTLTAGTGLSFFRGLNFQPIFTGDAATTYATMVGLRVVPNVTNAIFTTVQGANYDVQIDSTATCTTASAILTTVTSQGAGTGGIITTAYGVRSAFVSGNSITTATHFSMTNASGGGTVGTQIGLDIPALTKATTNIGIRNLSSTQLGSTGQLTVDTSGNLATSGSVTANTLSVGSAAQLTVSAAGALVTSSSATANSLSVGSAAQLTVSAAGALATTSTLSVGSAAQLTVSAAGALATSSSMLSSGATAGIGYATGAGGSVTQATSKTTGVTLNNITGQITMAAGAMAANNIQTFTLTNSAIAAKDILILNHISGGTVGKYLLHVQSAAGSATITVTNVSSGALNEQPVIAFAVIKAVTT